MARSVLALLHRLDSLHKGESGADRKSIGCPTCKQRERTTDPNAYHREGVLPARTIRRPLGAYPWAAGRLELSTAAIAATAAEIIRRRRRGGAGEYTGRSYPCAYRQRDRVMPLGPSEEPPRYGTGRADLSVPGTVLITHYHCAALRGSQHLAHPASPGLTMPTIGGATWPPAPGDVCGALRYWARQVDD
jgi:hypothetical protein